jgi:hypothetical protein
VGPCKHQKMIEKDYSQLKRNLWAYKQERKKKEKEEKQGKAN